jgi:hypothetical protein
MVRTLLYSSRLHDWVPNLRDFLDQFLRHVFRKEFGAKLELQRGFLLHVLTQDLQQRQIWKIKCEVMGGQTVGRKVNISNSNSQIFRFITSN